MDDIVDIGHLEAAKCLNARKDKLAIISAPYSCVTFSNNDTDSFDVLPNSTLTIQLVDLRYSVGSLVPQEKKYHCKVRIFRWHVTQEMSYWFSICGEKNMRGSWWKEGAKKNSNPGNRTRISWVTVRRSNQYTRPEEFTEKVGNKSLYKANFCLTGGFLNPSSRALSPMTTVLSAVDTQHSDTIVRPSEVIFILFVLSVNNGD